MPCCCNVKSEEFILENSGLDANTVKRKDLVNLKFHQNRNGCCQKNGRGLLLLTDNQLYFQLQVLIFYAKQK